MVSQETPPFIIDEKMHKKGFKIVLDFLLSCNFPIIIMLGKSNEFANTDRDERVKALAK